MDWTDFGSWAHRIADWTQDYRENVGDLPVRAQSRRSLTNPEAQVASLVAPARGPLSPCRRRGEVGGQHRVDGLAVLSRARR